MPGLRVSSHAFRSKASHKLLNAFIGPLDDCKHIEYQIEEAQQRGRSGKLKSSIDGRLIAVKDNICTKDFTTTCASGALQCFTSPYDASVVEYLKEAGSIIVGKTNLDEFGMGSHSTNSFFGSVRNSQAIDHTGDVDTVLSAGGSSGGSAVAVATGQCFAALGTDTGGSVRLPAAYNSVVGFKPSYGLISRWGVVAYANSLDTVGILARKCNHVERVFDVLNRHDSRDPTNLLPSSRYRIQRMISSRRDLSNASVFRIGVPTEYNVRELSDSIRLAWATTLDKLQMLGHHIQPVSLPTTKHALSAYYVIAPAEASSNLAKYDGVRYGSRTQGADGNGKALYANTRGTYLGSEVKRRILLGSYSLSAEALDNYFIQAQKVRRLVQRDFNAVFRLPHPLLRCADSATSEGVDVILCPTAPSPPPLLSSLAAQPPVSVYMADILTVPASLAGLPAVSVPPRAWSDADGKTSSGPVGLGLQVIGQYGDDRLVLQVASQIEKMTTKKLE